MSSGFPKLKGASPSDLVAESKVQFFSSGTRTCAASLDFDLAKRIEEWGSLRSRMAKTVVPGFSRDEWAYMVLTLDADHLWKPILEHFGNPVDGSTAAPTKVFRPKDPVAVWLSNNVSLLGPLMLIYLSLSGSRLRLKTGTRSGDLLNPFLRFVISELPNSDLAKYLETQVQVLNFSREDSRNAELASTAAVRIAFGSSDGVAQIHALPHSVESTEIAFSNRRSVVWMEPGVADEHVDSLIKVFNIYGQAGCTSPSRVFLIGGTAKDATDLRNRICQRWTKIVSQRPEAYLASSNFLAFQHARALGWDARLVEENRALIACGPLGLDPFEGHLALPITYATIGEALRELPPNVQTLGHAGTMANAKAWFRSAAGSGIKRFVPLSAMHHFGHTWDGLPYWRMLFDEVSVQL